MSYQIRLIVNCQNDTYTAEWIESDGQRSEPFPGFLILSIIRSVLGHYLQPLLFRLPSIYV